MQSKSLWMKKEIFRLRMLQLSEITDISMRGEDRALLPSFAEMQLEQETPSFSSIQKSYQKFDIFFQEKNTKPRNTMQWPRVGVKGQGAVSTRYLKYPLKRKLESPTLVPQN